MTQVFFPLSSVFVWWRYRETVHSVMQEFDVDERKAKRLGETMAPYSVDAHIAAVAPVKIREQIKQCICESVMSQLDRYLDMDALELLRGLVKRADITLLAHGHKSFYLEIVSESSLKNLANNGLRFVEKLSMQGATVSAAADKRLTGYYFDTDAEQLAIAGNAARKLKLGLLNFKDSPVDQDAPFKDLKSMKDVQAWLKEEGLYVQEKTEAN